MDSSAIIIVFLLIALSASLLVSLKAIRSQKASSKADTNEPNDKDEMASMVTQLTSELKAQMGEVATKALKDNNEQF